MCQCIWDLLPFTALSHRPAHIYVFTIVLALQLAIGSTLCRGDPCRNHGDKKHYRQQKVYKTKVIVCVCVCVPCVCGCTCLRVCENGVCGCGCVHVHVCPCVCVLVCKTCMRSLVSIMYRSGAMSNNVYYLLWFLA